MNNDKNDDNLFENSKTDKQSSKYQLMKNDVEKRIEDMISIKNEYKSKMIFSIFTAVCITIILCFSIFGYTIHTFQKNNQLSIQKASDRKKKKKAMQTLVNNLYELKDFISKNYYYANEIDNEEMITKTMQGYVEGLGDEYSEYFSKDEYSKFTEQALGSYCGIGVYLTEKDGHTEVVSTIKDSPAEEAGLQSGDIIAGVNEEDVSNQSSEEIVSKIKGKENTPIKLTVLRKNEYISFDLVTKEVQVYHVESKMLENNVGYIQLITFNDGCAEEFGKELESLKKQGAKKYILDLRYNTGGVVTDCEKIASFFLPINSTIYHIKQANGQISEVKTHTAPIDAESPMIVLVNDYSASASEILAGALKDHNRAKLLGIKTYGKGVIQAVYKIGDGSALKLTIAEYLTPNQISINKIGIEPDYKVELPEKEENKEFVDTQLKEAQSKLN